MNRKFINIISILTLLLYIVSLLCTNKFLKQKDAEISKLTERNESLQQTIFDLQVTIDDQKQIIAELKAEQAKASEEQKTNRGDTQARYQLTDTERDLVERVVMAESGGEPYEGQMLVAQCILNACEKDRLRPAEVIRKYAYAKSRPEPSDSVKQAVSAVFDRGEEITDKPIVYFYAPERVKSKFHESQIYALTVGGHKFFCERK